MRLARRSPKSFGRPSCVAPHHVEQMAMLEPGLRKHCAPACSCDAPGEDECVSERGSKGGGSDFLLGHMNVLGARIFEETPGVFSDACNKAIEFGIPVL